MKSIHINPKRVAIHGLVVVGLVIGATLVVNMSIFDEALHPDLVRMQQPGEPAALADNAVVGLLGLPAASDRDGFTVGRERISLYRDKYQKGEAVSLSEDEYATLFGETGLDRNWQADYPAASCTPRRELGCFSKLLAEVKKRPLSDERLREMLARYKEIREQGSFREIRAQDLSSQQPAYGLYMQLGKLNLADTYLQHGTIGFLTELKREDRFWRMVLDSGDSLLAKMVAVAGLWKNLQYLNEFLDRHHPDQAQMQMVDDLIEPLSKDQLDIAEAFASELRYLFPGMRLPDLSARPWPVRWFIAATLQENATINAHYVGFTQPLMELSGKSARDFHRQSAMFSGKGPEHSVFPPSLYNLGGKLWSGPLSPPGVVNYIGRMHDLSGIYSLLRIRVEAMQSGLPLAKGLIGESDHRNPYTDQAMAYDPQTGLLGFPCFSRSNCQIAL